MNLHLELLLQLAVWSKNYTFYYLQKFTIDDGCEVNKTTIADK